MNTNLSSPVTTTLAPHHWYVSLPGAFAGIIVGLLIAFLPAIIGLCILKKRKHREKNSSKQENGEVVHNDTSEDSSTVNPHHIEFSIPIKPKSKKFRFNKNKRKTEKTGWHFIRKSKKVNDNQLEVSRKLSTMSIDLGIPDDIYEMIDNDTIIINIKRNHSGEDSHISTVNKVSTLDVLHELPELPMTHSFRHHDTEVIGQNERLAKSNSLTEHLEKSNTREFSIQGVQSNHDGKYDNNNGTLNKRANQNGKNTIQKNTNYTCEYDHDLHSSNGVNLGTIRVRDLNKDLDTDDESVVEV